MRKLGIVAVVGCLALVIALPGPAGATVTGGTVFNCNVTLPVWPTANGPAVNCTGKTTGYLQGKTTTGTPFKVAAANSQFLGAAAKYSETCTFNEPLNGKANGTFSASGLKAVKPTAGTANSSGTNFVWTRIGSSALINLTGGAVFLPNGMVATGNRGTAAAAFAPTAPLPPGTCTAPKSLKATIVGAAYFQN
ncbi:MAG: hypothetical protein ACRDJ1_12065 [Actinomycetota bacterium]